jgi:hypothetical protein
MTFNRLELQAWPFRVLAAVICAGGSIAALTVVVVAVSGYRPLTELFRLPFALFIAYVAGHVAARGSFPERPAVGAKGMQHGTK